MFQCCESSMGGEHRFHTTLQLLLHTLDTCSTPGVAPRHDTPNFCQCCKSTLRTEYLFDLLTHLSSSSWVTSKLWISPYHDGAIFFQCREGSVCGVNAVHTACQMLLHMVTVPTPSLLPQVTTPPPCLIAAK